jgi:hypothetical protein
LSVAANKLATPANADNQDNIDRIDRLISQFLRKYHARRQGDEINGMAASQHDWTQVPRRHAAAIQEIDQITRALRALRGFLQSEGERVQLMMDEYEYTSVLSIQSAKDIAASLAWLKK